MTQRCIAGGIWSKTISPKSRSSAPSPRDTTRQSKASAPTSTLPLRASPQGKCQQTLGCVTELTEPQVDHGSGQVGKAHPTAARFVAAKRDPGGVLEAGERVLDVVALGVDRRVPRGRVEHPLLGRGVDGASLCGEIGP